MHAFWILSCLVLATAKPQYNYQQPAGQYYASNVVQQQYPANAYVGQQQQLLPALSSYAAQNQGAYVQQQSLPVSYSSLGSSVGSQQQIAAYPSQNIYTSYAQSPSYQGLIASPAPGVSYTGYTGYQSLQSGYSANAQTSYVQGQASNNGYYNNVYSQNAAQQASLAPEQTYLPVAYSAASADVNTNVGTLQQFASQHEQLQATQAPVLQSATHDHSVSSQSADLSQQHLSVEQKSPQSQEQLSLPQVDATSVPQLEQQSYQSGYQQTIQDQPAQTYLPAEVQQSYQNQQEHSYQSVQQSYQAQPAQGQHSVEVQQSIQAVPDQHYQSVQQTYANQPAQTYLPAGVQQSFQVQSEPNYQSAQQSYQTEHVQGRQSVGVEQSFHSQPEQSYQSVQQSYQTEQAQNLQSEQVQQSVQSQPEQSYQTVQQPAETYLPAGVQHSVQSQPEQSYQSVQQTYQTEGAQNHQSVDVQQSYESQPEQNYQSQSYQVKPEQNVQSFQSQPEQSVQTQSEQVYQSQTVHSETSHQQSFEPQIQSETESRALQPAVQTTIHKSIYIHVPPKELEEEDIEPLPVQPISPPKKHYKVIFIKAPSPAASRQIIQQIQPQAQEKTLVYVLVKKPEAPEVHHLQQPEIKSTDKPEVYFIKYRTQKDIEKVPAVEPTVQAVPTLQSIETAPLASEATIIEPRQNQPTHPPQFPALEEQNNLLSTEGANDEVQIPATTRRPNHHIRLNSAKHLQKSGARKPATEYLPANLN